MSGLPGTGRTSIRVLLAEDQSMIRGALAALLDLEDDIDVVAQVARGDEVWRRRGIMQRAWHSWISRCRVLTG